jgi:hypothetical protein
LLLLLVLPFAALLCASAGPGASRVEWAGQGNCRLLVKVDPFDIGGRARDELPAEIVLDLSAQPGGLGVKGRANIASIQVMKYDPQTGKPQPYNAYAYGRSAFDRPFRWYDDAIPYHFPEFPDAVSRTNGTIRRQEWARAGYFYHVIGEWNSGHLAWTHTQEGRAASFYGVYFDLLPEGQQPPEMPPNGWLGDGLNRCEPQGADSTGADHVRVEVADWNGDGLVDLLIGEQYGHLLWWPNLGGRSQPKFTVCKMVFEAEGLPVDVGMHLAPRVADWDGDGVQDLLAGTYANRVVFFKNVGTNRDRKLVYQGFLNADGATLSLPVSPLRKGSPDVFQRDYYPVLDVVDWDGDGDLDLLAGGYITGRIYFYDNTGRETNGLPLLKLRGPVEADGEPLNVRDWCAAPCAADLDGDGDLDLVSGHMPRTDRGGDSASSEHFLRYYENVGTRTKPVLKERPFPKQGSFPRSSLATPRAADWDGDGDLDLVVSARGNLYLYENIGTRTGPKFLVHDRWLPAPWGSSPLPARQFLDWNGDGLLDAVYHYTVRLNSGKGSPGVYDKALAVLPEGETIAHPSGIGDDWFWPYLYDLDQDGRIDVLFGDWGGHVWLHRNLSTPEKKRFDLTGSKLKMVNGKEVQVGPIGLDPTKSFDALQGARTVFTVADFDKDRLPDLVIGDTYGKVRFYQNVGTKAEPVFASPVEVGDLGIRLLVSTTDWDNDGWMDVICGAANGRVRVFRNTGTKGPARFDQGLDPKLPPIRQPGAIVADLNGDGDDDLFLTSTQGSCLVERSFLKHGYAKGQLLKLERR